MWVLVAGVAAQYMGVTTHSWEMRFPYGSYEIPNLQDYWLRRTLREARKSARP